MADAFVNYHSDGGVGYLSFADVSIDADAFASLQYAVSDYCTQISATSEIRVCVIDGLCGKTFTGLAENGEALHYWGKCTAEGPSITHSVAALKLPVIIAMNGVIVGPGLELALAGDVRLATPASQFGFPHVAAGVVPFEGGTQRLPRCIGRSKALEMILTGEMMDAQSAWQTGLIHYLVDEKEMNRTVEQMARKMAEKSPVSLMYVKEAVKNGMDMTLEQGVRLEADLYFLMHTTHDRTEGISAFKEKRKPLFKGR